MLYVNRDARGLPDLAEATRARLGCAPIDPSTVGTGDILEINAQDHRQ